MRIPVHGHAGDEVTRLPSGEASVDTPRRIWTIVDVPSPFVRVS